MKLTVQRNLFFPEHKRAYVAGEAIELPDDVARHWIETGAAMPVAELPEKETAVAKRKRETREAK